MPAVNGSLIKNLLMAGVLVFLVAIVFRGMRSGDPTVARASDAEKASVQVQPAVGKDDRRPLPDLSMVAGFGVVEPEGEEVRVAGQVPGVVENILVKEGAWVESGVVLVELAADVEKADLNVAAAEVQAARARTELSETILRRTAELQKKGAATADELDRARLTAAADEASLKAAEAALLRARASAGRMVIRAPRAGEIMKVKYRPGEYYQPGGAEPLVTMGNTRHLRVRMDVDERDVGSIRAGSPGHVTADAFPGRKFEAKVVEVGRRMGRKNIRTDDPTERLDTKILEVVLDLADSGGLVPGIRVMAYIRRADGEKT